MQALVCNGRRDVTVSDVPEPKRGEVAFDFVISHQLPLGRGPEGGPACEGVPAFRHAGPGLDHGRPGTRRLTAYAPSQEWPCCTSGSA